MTKKIFAIGDIHGCYNELMALMAQLPINKSLDTVVFMGDYTDRGPDSRKVVEQLIKWHKKYPHWVFLYGNHEDILLDHIRGNGRIYGLSNWYANGGRATLESYKQGKKVADPLQEALRPAVIPDEHLDFLQNSTVYMFEADSYIFVHAGLVPGLPVRSQDSHLRQLIWTREEFIEADYDWGKKVIFGHTADYDGRYSPTNESFTPIVMANKIGIDTAVCPPASRKLTAIELPSEKFYFQEAIQTDA